MIQGSILVLIPVLVTLLCFFVSLWLIFTANDKLDRLIHFCARRPRQRFQNPNLKQGVSFFCLDLHPFIVSSPSPRSSSTRTNQSVSHYHQLSSTVTIHKKQKIAAKQSNVNSNGQQTTVNNNNNKRTRKNHVSIIRSIIIICYV